MSIAMQATTEKSLKYGYESTEWDEEQLKYDKQEHTSTILGNRVEETSYTGDVDSSLKEDRVSTLLQWSFIFISFGYMLPWTALGSLIAYYKQQYSADFYVKVYCAYYLPGLPVALLQYKFDEVLDAQFGSRNTYMFRGVLSFTTMTIVMFSMTWVGDESTLVILFMALGTCGWLCHGTASMMASMFPRAVIAYLQIGFRCPELYTLVTDASLRLGKNATIQHLTIFYRVTAVVVLLALLCWILVCGCQTSLNYFAEKDNTIASDRERYETTPLLDVDGIVVGSSTSTIATAAAERADAEHSEDDWYTAGNKNKALPNMKRELYSETSSMYHDPIHATKSYFDIPASVVKTVALWLPFTKTEEDEAMLVHVAPLCAALILTMWSSIFQAAFFAYVESPNGRSIEQILYFARLFSDLLGRPLTFLARPTFLQSNGSLLNASIIRAMSLLIFFLYTFTSMFPKNDTFIIIYVCLFSVSSGYLSVLIYEYSARCKGMNRALRARAANTLNMSFQFAAFLAVLMSVFMEVTNIVT